MDEQGRGQAPSYRAFISYSHRDDATARKLHRQLETYRLPKHLVGRETGRGVVPERLVPIFRDLDELSAADDLSAEIKAALARSDVLVILASPAAKASKWVNLEIETFRALHGDRRPVLVALAEGEPAEAFPPALTAGGNEPVAADFRREASGGKRLALLKLVAGISGAPLDSLVQRDAQRQLRRVTAITGGALAAALVMALLLFIALRAQADAERQRHEAEGLVEYMLTELRIELRGVGRLDVMTSVNERAIQYYRGQGEMNSLPAASLLRWARILHAMGEDYEKLGGVNLARNYIKEAHRITSLLIAQQPSDADTIFAHAQSEFWIGYFAFLERNERRAGLAWRGYVKMAKELTRVAPHDSRSFRELGFAEGNICTLALDKKNVGDSAIDSCRNSVLQMEKAASLKPGDHSLTLDVANRQGWHADALVAAGRLEEALSIRNSQSKLFATVSIRRPNDADAQYRQASALIALGDLYLKLERRTEFIRSIEAAKRILATLSRNDSNNKEYQSRIDQIKQLTTKNGV